MCKLSEYISGKQALGGYFWGFNWIEVVARAGGYS